MMKPHQITENEKDLVLFVINQELENGKSIKELALETGVGQSTIGHIRAGTQNPGRVTFDKIAEYYNRKENGGVTEVSETASEAVEVQQEESTPLTACVTVVELFEGVQKDLRRASRRIETFMEKQQGLPEYTIGGLRHMQSILHQTKKSFEIK